MSSERFTLAFDLGAMNGISLGRYTDTTAWELLDCWQFYGGAQALSDWVKYVNPHKITQGATIIAEKFVLRNNPFVADLEGVRGEGVLVHYWGEDRILWQLRNCKIISGDKKSSDQIIKDAGLWKTGKAFGTKDARDYHDTILHSLWRMKSWRHEPTIRAFWPDDSTEEK